MKIVPKVFFDNSSLAAGSDYSELWNGFYVGMDRAAHEVLYTTGDDSVESFSYGI